jgi:SET domain-containing protein
MWFDRRLVMLQSPIQGIGTFAIEATPAGQLLILVTGGLVLTPDDRQAGRVQLEPELYNQEILPNDVHIVTPKLFHYYINHCCEPNAVDLSPSPTSTHYVAWRDIQAGAEVTTDYGIYGGAFIERCSCTSAQCRAQVTPDDWQRPELQQRYRGYFPWRIEQQIQRLNAGEDSGILER